MGKMVVHRLKQEDIELGSPFPHNLFDTYGILLLKKGQVIALQKQHDAIIARGAYFIAESTAQEQLVIKESPLEQMDDIYLLLAALSSSGATADFPARILELCRALQQACQKDADAALGAVFLNRESNYSIIHQIHCALVLDILLDYQGHSAGDRLSQLAAALTMNIGMIELQETLIRQKERLTPEQKQEVNEHPRRGVEILRGYGVTDQAWLDIVLQHHESIDGSGYPQGLKGKSISGPATILALADIYCAKLFPRSYRAPLRPEAAAQSIYKAFQEKSFDMTLGNAFLKKLGIFHPGSFVKLINGEIAIVVRRGEKIHHPVVYSFIDPYGMPLLKPRVRECAEDAYSITDSVAHTDINLCLTRERIWGYS